MRDVDDALALAAEPGDDVEQAIDLAAGQRRRGFVHDDHRGVERRALSRFRASCCSGRLSVPTSRSGAMAAPTRPSRSAARRRRARQSHAPEHVTAVRRQRDVLGHRQVREQRRLLVNRRDAEARAVGGSRRWWTWPRMSTVPASGVSAPLMILISVDLPAPFSPTRPCTSPASRSNDTPFSAWTPANVLTIPVTERSRAGPGRSARARVTRQAYADPDCEWRPARSRVTCSR